jgi:hypothetical protein
MPLSRVLRCLISLAVLWSPAGFACSYSYFDQRLDRPLLEEVAAYYDASVVFLARVGKVNELAPDPVIPYWLSVAPFEILETYSGRVEPDALIGGVILTRPGLDGMAPHNCLGATLHPSMEGRPMLVFGNRADRTDGRVIYRLALRSSHMDRCIGCEDILGRMRGYATFHGIEVGSAPVSSLLTASGISPKVPKPKP